MKKIISNNRLLALAFFTVFNFSLAANASAGPIPSPLEFKFIGMMKNNPVFELKFISPEAEEKMTITVKDRYGNSLYEENIRSSAFSKKFLLNTEEIGDEVLRFEIRSSASGKTVSFDVNPVNHFVRDWVVKANNSMN
jgi:hypothetical protein